MGYIVSCPQPGCGAAAETKDRWVWLSTHGPGEHVKTWCANGHGFILVLDMLRTAGSWTAGRLGRPSTTTIPAGT